MNGVASRRADGGLEVGFFWPSALQNCAFGVMGFAMNHPRPTRIVDARDQSLVLEFSDSSIRRFDVSQLLDFPFFAPLSNPALFTQAQIAHRTVVWPGDIDISPDTLWLDSVALIAAP